LKSVQQKILTDILEKIPMHPAAHAFIKGRSIRTFVAPHVGKNVVLRLDLQDYFPSFGRARIQAMFRTLGYPERVAGLLGGIVQIPPRVSSGRLAGPKSGPPPTGMPDFYMADIISRKVLQLRLLWRMCVAIDLIAGWQDWQRRLERRTHVMRMI